MVALQAPINLARNMIRRRLDEGETGAKKDQSNLNETMHDGMDPSGQISVPSMLDASLAPTGLQLLVGPPNIGGRCQDGRVQGCEDACSRPSQLFGSGTCQTLARVDGPPIAVKECRSLEAMRPTSSRSLSAEADHERQQTHGGSETR